VSSRPAAAPALLLCLVLLAGAAVAQQGPDASPGGVPDGDRMVQLDFDDVELSVVIDTIARLTGRNFIYDDRVRGRVTIVSPSRVTVEQAYAVFESVLQVKGFTVVEGPGGVMKIIPVRDAKESSIETMRGGPSPNRDKFVTRLIPLRYIDAEAITNTVKPLVSKDAAMVAYAPTNTIILTDTASNIRRLLSILEAIDVETYREELAVIRLKHADAATLGEQISEVFGAEISETGASARVRTIRRRRAARSGEQTADSADRGKIRIITDDRTNSLIALASRGQLQEIRALIRKLDVPITGGGSIRVYYLQHADAEELSETLSNLVSGAGTSQRGAGRTGQANATAQALRAAVTELEEGVNVTADPATNALVIQGSKEAYATLREVIEQLDIARPQVLVEALIMEVTVNDDRALGINSLLELQNGWDIVFSSITDGTTAELLGQAAATATGLPGAPFAANARRVTNDGDTTIQAIIRASASDSDTNVLSAPHLLTSDNEEAEIRIGNNIPIPTSRVESAAGTDTGLATSVNIERQDVGVTLRVTPQISEGDTLRLKIFQEITGIAEDINAGAVEDVGVSLTNRRVENTVVVNNGETVVIGGLVSDQIDEANTKVPFLGDIPVLGWLFKTRSKTVRKNNLLIFLTPNIVRNAMDLEAETIRKREEFRDRAGGGFRLSKREREEAAELGVETADYRGRNSVRSAVLDHADRYPLARMAEIEQQRAEQRAEQRAAAAEGAGTQYGIRAEVFRDPDEAEETLTQVLDFGYDGTLVSGETDGVLLLELQVGPYPTLEEAQEVQSVLRRAFDFDPSVMVLDDGGDGGEAAPGSGETADLGSREAAP